MWNQALGEAGKSLTLTSAVPGGGFQARPPRRDSVRNRAQDASTFQVTGVDEVNAVSYLPATFATLFFLAASLLLGLIR